MALLIQGPSIMEVESVKHCGLLSFSGRLDGLAVIQDSAFIEGETENLTTIPAALWRETLIRSSFTDLMV